jgi:hypothetical protein
MRVIIFEVAYMAGTVAGSSVAEQLLRSAATADAAKRDDVSLEHGNAKLTEVAALQFSDRLALLVNTAYQISLLTRTQAFFNDNPTNLSVYSLDFGTLPADGSVEQSIVDDSC